MIVVSINLVPTLQTVLTQSLANDSFTDWSADMILLTYSDKVYETADYRQDRSVQPRPTQLRSLARHARIQTNL